MSNRTITGTYIALYNLLLLGLIGCGTPQQSSSELAREPVQLDVVYPRLEGGAAVFKLPEVDSTFAFGSIRPTGAKVYVNGISATVYSNGAFLVYFPLDTISRQYNFLAVGPAGDSLRLIIPFEKPVSRGLNQGSSQAMSPHPLNSKLPARITILETHAHISAVPDQAYMLLPPQGAVALADSFVAGFYRVLVRPNLHGWIAEQSVSLDPDNRKIPKTSIGALTVVSESLWTELHIPMKEPILFNITQNVNENKLELDLFQATSRINQIRYDPMDDLVREIHWQQLEDDLLRLEVDLRAQFLWGYGAEYREGELILKIRKSPKIERNVFKNRSIALDAGHGGKQPGSIGPTRLLEKEANLQLTQRLAALLIAQGAKVILTRDNDSTVALYDRIDDVVQRGAELLISIHNNALADGENPFVRHGTGVYYYHPQSHDLAQSLHDALVSATGLRDDGLYYKNLAMVRPTELLAVLVECAYIMHPEEEILLRDSHFLDLTAQGLLDGLKTCLKARRVQQKTIN